MASAEYSRARRSSFAGALLLGLVLGVILFAAFLRHARVGLWNRWATLATGRTLAIDSSQPAVVNKIQQLERLETVRYSLDKIVEGDRESSILPDFLAGDKLLLVVHGEVLAGVDLARLPPDQVRIAGRGITVHLPAAEVFLTTLDNAHTRVYSRTTGLLVAADPNLESEVRATAQQQIQTAAIADGILPEATKNARATVSSLLHGLGFESVNFD